MLGTMRARVVHFRLFQELAPRLVREQRESAQLAAALKMREDFAGNVFLLFERRISGSLRSVLDERFLGICSFTMNQPHETDELVPGLPVHITISARVNRSEFPFIFAGKRLDGLNQGRGQRLYFSGRTLRRDGLPQVGAHVEIFVPEPIPLADAGFKVFRSRKIVKLRKMT